MSLVLTGTFGDSTVYTTFFRVSSPLGPTSRHDLPLQFWLHGSHREYQGHMDNLLGFPYVLWFNFALGLISIFLCPILSIITLPNLVPRSHSVLHWKVRSPFPLAVGDLGTRLYISIPQNKEKIKLKPRMKLNNNIRLIRLVVYNGLLVFWNFVWGHVLTEQEGGSYSRGGHQVQQRWICLSIPGQVKLQLVLSRMRGEWVRARLRLTPLQFDN